jgi:hypothetical protein
MSNFDDLETLLGYSLDMKLPRWGRRATEACTEGILGRQKIPAMGGVTARLSVTASHAPAFDI